MRHEGSWNCGIAWKGCTYTHQVAIIESEKFFGRSGRNITLMNQITQLEELNLSAPSPAMKSHPATVKHKPDAIPMFYRALKILLALQDHQELTKLEAQGVIEPVELEGVINASPVIWLRKKDVVFDYALTTNSMSLKK